MFPNSLNVMLRCQIFYFRLTKKMLKFEDWPAFLLLLLLLFSLFCFALFCFVLFCFVCLVFFWGGGWRRVGGLICFIWFGVVCLALV